MLRSQDHYKLISGIPKQIAANVPFIDHIIFDFTMSGGSWCHQLGANANDHPKRCCN